MRKKRNDTGLLVALAVVVTVLVVLITVQAMGLASQWKESIESTPGATNHATDSVQTALPAGDGTAETTVQTDPDADRAALLEECRTLERGYFYDEAIEKLNSADDPENPEIAALLSEIQGKKDGLVKYEGQIYHVFFHSLIADTSKAFDGDYAANGYNMYMTTVEEFKAMLPLLEQEGYILYHLEDCVNYDNGKVTPRDIYLPEGKKPLVLSVDDVDYYEYMKPDGFADRLDVDEQGRVVTVMKQDDGSEKITYDGDVFPILDAYVAEHPEFSWRGAKGIAATTGYQGAFGYRITDLEQYSESEQQYMLNQVKKVAQALRDSGWEIASHSYTHNQYWNNKTMSMPELEYDTGRWLNEIMPYVGETHIFIAPFGVSYDTDDQRFQYLVEHGFYIYCTVYSGMTTEFHDNCCIQSRLNLDGLTMLNYPERISKYFFDPAQVVDKSRPPIE